MSRSLFIFAGEPSADLHGEKLIEALLIQDPSLKIFGVGGPRMRGRGMECLLPMEAFQVMGFIDVFFALLRLARHFYFLRRIILQRNPEAALFIDYADFNLRLEGALRKKGYQGKLIHYISPSVWAWRKNRVQQMERSLDLLLIIFPFEKDCFSHSPLKVRYVGHPLIERLLSFPYRETFLQTSKKIIAFFPGSRKKELLRNFPLMLRLIKRLPPSVFAISLAEPKFRPLLEKMIREEECEGEFLFISSEHSYDLMKRATMAIAKSGTVTLELALHEVPTIVIYKISLIDLFIAKHLFRIRLPHYCIVNIIAKTEVFPEFFGAYLDETLLFKTAEELLLSPSLQEKCRDKCRRVKICLQEKRASVEAAKEILSGF